MIEEILPSSVASAEAFDDAAEAPLFPEEEEAVARAVKSRRLAFATARMCARRALGELGLPPSAIPREEGGAPVWPEGVVGSITHCEGYRGAAVAFGREVATVGIDAEPDAPIKPAVLERIALPDERDWLLRQADADPRVSWDRLLFSAKESVYKAWFPLARQWLGFEDATIAIDPEAGTFEARLLVPGPDAAGRPLTGFSGRWLARNGLVVTAIAVPAGG